MKVLIVEDNIHQLNLYSRIMSSKGFEVEKAEDAEAAIEKINSSKPDLILLDYLLPKENGGAVIRHVRETLGDNSVPIIVLTAYWKNMEECFSLGATAYITKGSDTLRQLTEIGNIYLQ